jgi:hypothetical protein
MNRPNILVNKKKVPIEGGARPSMNIFGVTLLEILVMLLASITKKNETSNVMPKNSAAPTIYNNSLIISRLLDSAVNCNGAIGVHLEVDNLL